MASKRYQVQCLGDLFETQTLFESPSLQKALSFYQEHCHPYALTAYQQFQLIDIQDAITLGCVTSSGVGWYDSDGKFEFHHASKETQKPAQ